VVHRVTARILGVIASVVLAAGITVGQPPSGKAVVWNEVLKQPAAWYGSTDAIRIADNVVSYQRHVGGWPKNIDMAASLTDAEFAALGKQKSKTDATIDNGATFTQLNFLGRVYRATKLPRYKEAFLKGIDYLLKAQYDNGGWPQFYPDKPGYHAHVTFNDGAMIGVLKLLRDVAQGKPDFVFVDDDRRHKAATAVERGTAVILKCQVVTRGRRTIWAAQYDEVTLAPAAARTFEPVALASAESVGVVRFLMGIKQPNREVVEAIESAIAWFEQSKITGHKWVERPDGSTPSRMDRVLVSDNNAGPLWARFYDIETNRPIFAGRDSKIKYDVAEIEYERRNSYNWYVDEPAELLTRDYPSWQKKWRRTQ
jgi:PelA/Pel-15E family pectate lyase